MNIKEEKAKTKIDNEIQEIEGVPEKKERDFVKLLSDQLHLDDKYFTSRVNLFFLAESLLLITYVTSLTIEASNKIISFIIGFFGIFITYLYMIVLWRHTINIHNIKDELENLYPNYKKMKRCIMIPGGANMIFGRVLPGTFFIFWIILLAITFFFY
jgi:hypothetical protein